MNKEQIAKKYLTEAEYKIWERVQIKKANEFTAIAKDL
jgi:hypothetical protein